MTLLVATDLDGTLLNSESRVSRRTLEVLRSVAAKPDLILVAATGRTLRSVANLETGVPFDFAICSNGAQTANFRTGRILREVCLETGEVQRLLNVLEDNISSLGFGLATTTGCWFTNRFLQQGHALDDTSWGSRLASTVDLPSGVLKVFVSSSEELVGDRLRSEVERLARLSAVDVTIGSSGTSFVEVTAATADKGRALEVLRQSLGVTRESCTAFGDEQNDLGMLRAVGVPIVVANGSADMRRLFTNHVESNDCDGVAKYLKERFLKNDHGTTL